MIQLYYSNHPISRLNLRMGTRETRGMIDFSVDGTDVPIFKGGPNRYFDKFKKSVLIMKLLLGSFLESFVGFMGLIRTEPRMILTYSKTFVKHSLNSRNTLRSMIFIPEKHH